MIGSDYYFFCQILIITFFLLTAKKQEGEPVEFTTEEDAMGRTKASYCSGPDDSNVQGAPRNDYDEYEY